MGGSQSQSADMVGKPVVVIVGGGYGGVECAKALEKKMNCVLIDRKDYFFHNVGALRGAAVEDFEKGLCIPYDKLLKTGSVVKGDVTEVHPTHLRVHGHEDDIKFDYLVLATGTSYAFPAKVPFAKALEVQEMYKNLREIVKKSKNILVIGGGPTGSELAGEIASVHKNIKVTLVHPAERLLSGRGDLNPKLGINVADQLRSLGVQVMLKERIDFSSLGQGDGDVANARYIVGPLVAKTTSGKDIETDLVFFCNGAHINSASYQESLGKAVNEHGEIHVNQYFQIDSSVMTMKNIFAIGDCCDADNKMAFAAGVQGEHVAQNIIRLSKGSSMKSYSKVPAAMSVPVGAKGGSTQLPIVGVVGSTVTSMMKGGDLMTPKTWQNLGYPKPPEEFLVHSGEVNEQEKKKNLMAALECSEEDAEKIQNQLLPARDLGDAHHI
mmetsp:Transcript_27409/g.38132  ORF Transcript_27409/g.38132 Transcript_27409/m.38132 type:complete len:438 (-) Transcript_27409:815-2128(-)|eukprot:CAMPEP_0201483252 /NCGR_PEP_ID=MMETSP0151_2-20130828/7471_1 /ASSEMBLY_ACC=CAM_ASM_000257 /TAXON_ID=200890 /ORGANISM="Paramoeba atlantica, Strain 621/1 / CCAP 1560/9" /LENGTH=437 /DNA_ID=CAMNT_0047866313 /DNA_START=89 /DNA_END=1402 /DNA_ORIENTATION=-